MSNDEVKEILEGPQWTPLESAPQDGTGVIVSNARRAIGLGRYNGNGWEVKRLGGWTPPAAEEITHWLPLHEDEVRLHAEETNARLQLHDVPGLKPLLRRQVLGLLLEWQ
jgi:hypothetical protein